MAGDEPNRKPVRATVIALDHADAWCKRGPTAWLEALLETRRVVPAKL